MVIVAAMEVRADHARTLHPEDVREQVLPDVERQVLDRGILTEGNPTDCRRRSVRRCSVHRGSDA